MLDGAADHQRPLRCILDLRSQALALPVSCTTEGQSESKEPSTLLVSTLFSLIYLFILVGVL